MVNPPRHILLVEDDPDLLVVLTHVLEQAGYRVTPVARRVDARVALSRGDVDLVVTDSALRGGNGDDIAKAAIRDGLPIVMMSGEPDRIAQQVAFLEAHPDHALVGGNTLIIDEASRVIGIRNYPSDYARICKTITRYNPIAQPAVMLRRSTLPASEPYDAAFPRCQDYELWLRLAAVHPVANLDRPVLRYRVSQSRARPAAAAGRSRTRTGSPCRRRRSGRSGSG